MSLHFVVTTSVVVAAAKRLKSLLPTSDTFAPTCTRGIVWPFRSGRAKKSALTETARAAFFASLLRIAANRNDADSTLTTYTPYRYGQRTAASVWLGDRDSNPNCLIQSQVFCRLNYPPTQSGRVDLNHRPHRPERCALPSCATPRLRSKV